MMTQGIRQPINTNCLYKIKFTIKPAKPVFAILAGCKR